MNNSVPFTSANPSKAADVGAVLNFNASSVPRSESRKVDQPFSNVLDRAVQARPKTKSENKAGSRCENKKDPLTAGRSEEHRSERSVEAHAENKTREEARTEKKNAESQTEVELPHVCVAVPQVVMPMETLPATDGEPTTNQSAESGDMGVATNSTSTGTTNAVAPAVAPTRPLTALNLAAQNASSVEVEINASSAAEQRNPTSVTQLAAVAESSGEISTDVDLLAANKVVADASQKLEANLQIQNAEVQADVDSVFQESTTELPPITAATAREVALGVLRDASAAVENPGDETVGSAQSPETIAASVVAATEVQKPLRAARRARDEDSENSGGIAAAKIDATMNNVLKKEEIAGLTGQNLPGGVAAMKNLPSDSQRMGSREINSIEMLHARSGVGPTRSDSSEVRETQTSNAAASSARIGEIISREVRMFKRGGDDLMEVVLTPDARTQISLKLQWRDGQVEVQARCDMGNYHSLNGDWPQLQAALAGHGVRLSHLSERVQTGFTEFFNNSGFSQQRGGGRQESSQQPRENIFQAVPTVSNASKTSAAKTVKQSNQRLESWA
jgi:hypothetical protein